MSEITLYTRNILETGTVTVTGTPDEGFPASRLYDRSIGFYWKDTVIEAKNFVVDQGTAGNLAVDFLAIHRHNFSGIAMQWQYSNDNFVEDINDTVTDWTQGDNNQIIKTMVSSLTQRYWRVTLASMTDPKCSEIFMSYGRTFEVKASPSPVYGEKENVQWNPTVGGLERSTKFGDERRIREYGLFLSPSDLVEFKAAMTELDSYSKPFYIKDDEGAYFLCRLLSVPEPVGDHKTHKRIYLSVIEML